MLRSVSDMRGFTIHATDGDMGAVDECLFDDEQWTIRYLVVNTDGWLTGRLVLVSPIAFRAVDWDRETFDVALTRQQVEQSPNIATDQPVSRQQEEEYSRYYGYPYYWDGLGLWGAGIYPRTATMSAVNSTYGETVTERPPKDDPHLRSTRQVTGYAIQARDRHPGPCRRFHRGRRELGAALYRACRRIPLEVIRTSTRSCHHCIRLLWGLRSGLLFHSLTRSAPPHPS